MNNEEANQVLQELNEVRPEMLNDKAKRLFEAIMLIADERDKANERVDELINEVTIKDAEIDKKDKVIDMIVNTIVGDRKILKLVCNKIINKKEDECFEQNKLCDDCIKEYFYKKAEDK